MKKALLTLTVIIATFNFVCAQADWIAYKIDDKLSVKLPTQPTSTDHGVVAGSKDSLICFASIIGETDSASIAKIILTPDFSNGLKMAIAGTQKGLTLGDIKSGKWNGYYCYDVDGINTSKRLKASFFLIILGGRIYVLGAVMPDNHDINEKNIFFNTLELN